MAVASSIFDKRTKYSRSQKASNNELMTAIWQASNRPAPLYEKKMHVITPRGLLKIKDCWHNSVSGWHYQFQLPTKSIFLDGVEIRSIPEGVHFSEEQLNLLNPLLSQKANLPAMPEAICDHYAHLLELTNVRNF